MPKKIRIGKKTATHALVPIGVKSVPTDSLKPNPHNPRKLFDTEPMETLKESIANVGILVPLTVYQQSSDGSFIILDGQRRWMCAQKLGLPKVPVNQVGEPTLVQNIVTMFQIHGLREDWELMPTALKVEVLMNELDERSDKKLATLTGLDIAVIQRCKKLLSFDRKYQDMMMDPNPDVRKKADLFIEMYPFLHDRVVKKLKGYTDEKLIQKMLAKYDHRSIRAVTDFRKVKQYIANARRANALKALTPRLREFIETVELPPEHLLLPEADISAAARTLANRITKVRDEVVNLEVDDFVGEEGLWESLEELLKAIRKCLAEAGRRIKELSPSPNHPEISRHD